MEDKSIQVLYQTEARLSTLENSIKTHEKEIEELKKDQKDFFLMICTRLDGMTGDMHRLAIASKDIVIGQQKDSNKNKGWMLTIIIGFFVQTAVGIILIILKKSGV